eukprot:TRINITY_DN42458_c0_g1_i1.p1 TRINITY_DN42458_c0_g1~~TRINITY_DN42458_c0_g1_i1.p1  ORF type:complete len:371 (+),score=73.94 TRINITY_DN42458_c0_g1_i1:96-1208(+)
MKPLRQPSSALPRVTPRRAPHSARRKDGGSQPKTNGLVVLPPDDATQPTPVVANVARPRKRAAQERTQRRVSVVGMQRDTDFRSGKDKSRPSYNLMAGVNENQMQSGRFLDPPDAASIEKEVARRLRNVYRRHNVGQLEPDEDLMALALTLAKRYRLQFHEVKWILQACARARTRSDGSMDRKLFGQFLLDVFDTNKIDDVVLDEGYRTLDAATGPIDLDLFFEWVRENMFGVFAPLMADPQKRESDDIVRKLAKRYEISPVLVDKIKKKFDSFDMDGNNAIDFEEFGPMIAKLLGVRSKSDLPLDRLLRFWQELDQDDNGAVNFEEFTEWYVKYFSLEKGNQIIESFYSSFLPKAVQDPEFVRRASNKA